MLRMIAIAAALLAAASSGAGHAAGGASAPAVDPTLRAAAASPRSAHGVMLALARAGSRVVAAGERGIVLWSDDDGMSWQQAKVPVSVTLTALAFVDDRQGWAVGHGGVVLATSDAGQTWHRQLEGRGIAQLEFEAARTSADAARIAQAERLVADGADKPLLAVHFWDARRGFAVGAYGLAVATEDGGATWQSWMGRIENPKRLHLNAIHAVGQSVFLAGEQGLLLRSTDGAAGFQALPSPYRGSWFAIAGQGDRVVVAGLRGNVYWSADGGRQWQASQVPVPISLAQVTVTQSGTFLFVNQAGQLLRSTDGGRSLQPVRRPPGPPVTVVAESGSGALLAATFAGVHRLPPLGAATGGPRP